MKNSFQATLETAKILDAWYVTEVDPLQEHHRCTYLPSHTYHFRAGDRANSHIDFACVPITAGYLAWHPEELNWESLRSRTSPALHPFQSPEKAKQRCLICFYSPAVALNHVTVFVVPSLASSTARSLLLLLS